MSPYSTEPDGTVHPTTPIGAAITFEVNDDGSQWDFTIRGHFFSFRSLNLSSPSLHFSRLNHLYSTILGNTSENWNSLNVPGTSSMLNIGKMSSVDEMWTVNHQQYVENGFLELQVKAFLWHRF